MFCGKCRTEVDDDGRDEGGWWTCGYGGSHYPVPNRPFGRVRVSSANRRSRPSTRMKQRQVVKRQLAENDREQGREVTADRAVEALRRFQARRASAIDSRESRPEVNQRLFGITDGK